MDHRMGFLTLLALTISFLIPSSAGDNRMNFNNYGVYKITPSSMEDIEFLKELDGSSDSLMFLESAETPGREVHIVVAPHKQQDFEHVVNETSMFYEMVEKNLQKHLDAEDEFTSYSRATRKYDWSSYASLDETYNWMSSLAKKYPDQVTSLVGGKTTEGREIRGVKVSYRPGNKAIFLEGGMHAREWISPATVTFILNKLLTSNETSIRKLAENYDWYVFPHANPDGYVYTQTTNRLWRKTRSRNGICYGTDPNRNWAFHWNEAGTSRNPCAENYAGRSAFSEIETKTFAAFIKSLKNIRTYLAFHSYSQLLLFSYGHTKQHTSNHKDLKMIGNAAIKALSRRYGTKYETGTIYEVIYPASGSSAEWAYGVQNIPLSYTYELRPKDGWNGFVLPPGQIIPTGLETLDSLVALVKEADRLGYYN